MTATATATATSTWLAAINAPGLNVVEVEWTTEVKPAAAHKGTRLSKRTSAQVLTGAEYASLAVNNERETGDLPWGEWAEGLYPYVITHKGRDYARLYTVEGTLASAYYVNDERVTREAFNEYLTPAARKPKRSVGGVLTIKIENIRVL
jgi:hypothetical protein